MINNENIHYVINAELCLHVHKDLIKTAVKVKKFLYVLLNYHLFNSSLIKLDIKLIRSCSNEYRIVRQRSELLHFYKKIFDQFLKPQLDEGVKRDDIIICLEYVLNMSISYLWKLIIPNWIFLYTYNNKMAANRRINLL